MKRIERIDHDHILENLVIWSARFTHFAFYITSKKEFKAGFGSKSSISLSTTQGAFDRLESYQSGLETTAMGFLGYDLKNDLESLSSINTDPIKAPEASFFEPQVKISFADGALELESDDSDLILELIQVAHGAVPNFNQNLPVSLDPQTSRDGYLEQAYRIKDHLKKGDIYEANYCIQFSGNSLSFDPHTYFIDLQKKTEAPFSVFAKFDEFYVMSASPERFLKRTGSHVISQPIKGTKKRSEDPIIDLSLKNDLREDKKEQSENVMIVDLVRNDLSRVAKRGTVRVDELFGVQTFRTVHHLVSAVSCELDAGKNSWDLIKACFPMGSMTGAPKVSAMQIIGETESFKRGVYSGAFGFMEPNGDFDFNVLIRTMLYNSATGALGLSVGSAITIDAVPEKEYEECLLKAHALMDIIAQKSHDHESVG